MKHYVFGILLLMLISCGQTDVLGERKSGSLKGEETHDADLDWCPESSYSFQVVNRKITDLRLDFMAG
jgi:hypothetical protein